MKAVDKMGIAGLASVVALWLALVLSVDSCGKVTEQQIINTISSGAACVVAVVEDVTVGVDVPKTVATCGVTASDIYQIVSELLAATPDAGPDGALGASPREAHLRLWLDAASKAKAAK